MALIGAALIYLHFTNKHLELKTLLVKTEDTTIIGKADPTSTAMILHPDFYDDDYDQIVINSDNRMSKYNGDDLIADVGVVNMKFIQTDYVPYHTLR
jgi:hypothetical protein